MSSSTAVKNPVSIAMRALWLRRAFSEPRFEIHHTSAHEKGQVYIPEINWMLMVATVGLVFGFRTSTNLAAAYGMAVTTTMVITAMLAFVVARERWGIRTSIRLPKRDRSRLPPAFGMNLWLDLRGDVLTWVVDHLAAMRRINASMSWRGNTAAR